MNDCRYYNNGKCGKFPYSEKCKDFKSAFADATKGIQFDITSRENACKEASGFGNQIYNITDEDIDKLKAGEILYDFVNEEYCIFLQYEKEEKHESL